MKTVPVLIIFALFLACDDNVSDPVIIDYENCFKLSELVTKTDHFLPFTLYNDIDSGLTSARLNDKPVKFNFNQVLEFNTCGFFELSINYKDQSIESDTFLFTINDTVRGLAEWGIPPPPLSAIKPSILDIDEIICLYPRRYVSGMGVPFIFYLYQGSEKAEGYALGQTSGRKFYIKHGEGSILLPSDEISTVQNFMINNSSVQLDISISGNIRFLPEDSVSEDIVIEKNSIVRICNDLIIPENRSVMIDEGAIILIDQSVNIENHGRIFMNGALNNPVLVTCTEYGKYWGGFISTGNSAINAQHVIFCQSGYHETGDYGNIGHAHRQALFYSENSELTLKNCFMIDHIGQVFYPQYSNLILESILVQRAKTGGQVNFGKVSIVNSIFTDFPDDRLERLDMDNDALYIHGADAIIDNCIFMYAKDDGLDSGGDDGGTVTVTNSRFEACHHEGAALSSDNEVVKIHRFENCIFYNCGQGLELGYSSINHEVHVDNCLFQHNGVGIRYGDNYDWSSVKGRMFINNSRSLNNGKDVWNMVHSLWAPRLENMIFNSVKISAFSKQYPDLEVIR